MKVLISGGTGFLGAQLTIELLKNNHEVIWVSRNTKEPLLPVKVINWEQLKTFNESVDVIINLSGESLANKKWSAKQKKIILGSRLLTAQSLIEYQERQQVETIISSSAIGIYGNSEESKNEGSGIGEGFLADVCKKWEDVVKKCSAKRKVFLRTGIVLDRMHGALAKIENIYQMGFGGHVGSGKQWMSWIHVEDWVSAVVFILESNKIEGPVNLVAPVPQTNYDFSKKLLKVFKQPLDIWAPGMVLKIILGDMSELILAGQNVIPQKLEYNGFKFKYPTIEDAFDNLYPPELGVHNIVKYYQWVPTSKEGAFDFFKDEKNLERITPELLNFKVLTKSTDEIQEGTLIDYQLKIRGVPAKWRTLISKWNPPHQFMDSQLKGPYRRWEHTHSFVELKGGTLLLDQIVYNVPLKKIGNLFAGFIVKKDVETIFSYRKKIIKEIFKN